MKRISVPAVLPSWLYEVHPDSHLTTNDMTAILGCSAHALCSAVRAGTFPSDGRTARMNGHMSAHKWKVRTIIKLSQQAKE